ncbi:ATP synthase subunit I [Metabacillus sp. HB246100]
MFDLQLMFHSYKKYIFYLLALYVLGWGLTDYQQIFLGLIIGTSISFYNLWMLVRKSTQFGEALANGRKVTLGTATRMASAIGGVFFALKFPEYIDLISVVLGLMTMYVVIMIDFLLKHLR